MCRSDLQAITLRSLHFEVFEARLVLSAQPGTEVQANRADSDALVLADIHASTGVSHAQQDLGLTGFGQTVAVIDSGIAYDHEALGGGFGSGYRVVGGWDFAENDADPFDDAPAGLHGTHIAGIIGSQHAEHLGVAPNVDLVALRVFDDQGSSDFKWVEGALQWVYDHRNDFEHPITTVNLSLGAGWSGSGLPEWATLEDEFAQLRRNGIFVSVAAGNNFETDRTAGLNYPAASPHVVPVASHGSDGAVSPFSRRSNRVLVAPGEDITSTATDFLYDFNGITDDFYTASGTSMAAAYVSGISVLVRQAMETVGWRNISHDSIYGLLRDTADLVYDPVTKARYRHVDVQAALDAVMSSSVHDLGRLGLQQTTELSATTAGTWYRFTAARSGVLTLETLNIDQNDVQLELFDASRRPLSSDGDHRHRLDADVRAGQSLFVRLEGSDKDVAVRFTNLLSATGQTLEVFGTPDVDDFRLDLGAGQWLTVNGVQYELPGGTEATIRIHGGAGADSLLIDATGGNETVWLSTDAVRLRSSGLLVEADNTQRNYVYSVGGENRAYLHDSSVDDTFHGFPEYSELIGLEVYHYVEGFASVRAYSTHGGTDRAWLYDSPRDDLYLGLPQYSLLTSGSSYNYAEGFADVHAVARRGGDDTARLHDLVTGEPSGNLAEGFESVLAYTEQAGSELVGLFDATDDDAFDGLDQIARAQDDQQGDEDEVASWFGSKSDDAYLQQPILLSYAFGLDAMPGLDAVHAAGSRGDRAETRGTPTDDIFTSRASLKTLLGINDHQRVHGFEVNDANVGDGGWGNELFSDTVARDAVYQNATPLSWLESLDATVHWDLAVDYLLGDDTWLS